MLSDNYLFPALKQNPGCQQFKDREVERAVTWWLITEDMGCYQQRIEKFVSESEKHLSYGADYVEKQ